MTRFQQLQTRYQQMKNDQAVEAKSYRDRCGAFVYDLGRSLAEYLSQGRTADLEVLDDGIVENIGRGRIVAHFGERSVTLEFTMPMREGAVVFAIYVDAQGLPTTEETREELHRAIERELVLAMQKQLAPPARG